jgi:hypothetical protein
MWREGWSDGRRREKEEAAMEEERVGVLQGRTE